MSFQASYDRIKGSLAKFNVDSMMGLLPRYYPVVDTTNAEVEEDDMKTGLGGTTRWTVPQLFFGCSVLSFLFSAGSAAGLAWGYAMTQHASSPCPSHKEEAGLERRLAGSAVSDFRPAGGNQDSSCFSAMLRLHGTDHPFQDITGVKGHIAPPMYGKVREKTIWSYWYHPVDCPSSKHCKLPSVVELCATSIRKNKGTFDFHILHMDTVRNFVSMMELPLRWDRLQPVRQKEALVNALLARYGGVALDLSSVLLRPLDDLWTELVLRKATFRGYMYRLNGQPWQHPQATATWFFMSRREGIFSTAVRNQVVNFCDAYKHPDLQIGDRALTPVLGSINASLPSCLEDRRVSDHGACPPAMQPRSIDDPNLIPPRTDRKVILHDPRDGPHLPFAELEDFSMGTWPMSNASNVKGLPPECGSPSECWQKVVLPRYNEGSLVFVKLFHSGGPLAFRTREELLQNESTFFHGWLKLAGVDTDERQGHKADDSQTNQLQAKVHHI